MRTDAKTRTWVGVVLVAVCLTALSTTTEAGDVAAGDDAVPKAYLTEATVAVAALDVARFDLVDVRQAVVTLLGDRTNRAVPELDAFLVKTQTAVKAFREAGVTKAVVVLRVAEENWMVPFDGFVLLGVRPDAKDQEVRAAYAENVVAATAETKYVRVSPPWLLVDDCNPAVKAGEPGGRHALIQRTLGANRDSALVVVVAPPRASAAAKNGERAAGAAKPPPPPGLPPSDEVTEALRGPLSEAELITLRATFGRSPSVTITLDFKDRQGADTLMAASDKAVERASKGDRDAIERGLLLALVKGRAKQDGGRLVVELGTRELQVMAAAMVRDLDPAGPPSDRNGR